MFNENINPDMDLEDLEDHIEGQKYGGGGFGDPHKQTVEYQFNEEQEDYE